LDTIPDDEPTVSNSHSKDLFTAHELSELTASSEHMPGVFTATKLTTVIVLPQPIKSLRMTNKHMMLLG